MPRSRYYRRPDGLYEAIRVIDGKRVAFRGKKPADVDRKIREYRVGQDDRKQFRAVAEEWWNEHEQTIAWNTQKSYKPAIERAKDHFGKEPVSKITAQDVDGWIREFSRGGRSQKVVTTQLQIVRQILGFAVLKGYAATNAAQVVKPPRGLPREYRQPPTTAEVKAIKELAGQHFLPALIYYTGMRWGEAMGLRWEDIDREAKLIHIRRSVYYVSTKPMIKTPKTEMGVRVVPLLDALASVLPKGKLRGYLFTEEDGKSLLARSRASRLWSDWQKEAGTTLTAHQVRHGYATALLEAGVDAKVAQRLLGHAQISTTLDIYTHVRDEAVRDAAARMNASF